FGQAVLDAPAEENADVVPLQFVVANDGTLRTRAGMQAQTGVVVRMAIFDRRVMADLPTDAVAVVIAGGHTSHVNAIAILEKNTAGIVAIEIRVLLFVAVECDVLNRDVGNFLAAENWKERRDLGLAHEPIVFAQSPIEFKTLAVASDQRSL